MISWEMLFGLWEPFARNASQTAETEHSVSAEGTPFDALAQTLRSLHRFLEANQIAGFCQIRLNGDEISAAELEDLQLGGTDRWEVRLLKDFGSQNSRAEGYRTLFFYDTGKFTTWLSNVAPFGKQSFFNQPSPCAVVVRHLPGCYHGSRFFVGSEKTPVVFSAVEKLPDPAKLHETIHFITTEEMVVAPANFLATGGDLAFPGAPEMLKKSTQSLAACLVNEFYGPKKVVLKGIRRTETHLDTADLPAEAFTHAFQSNLLESVKWVYEEKTDTRLKLLLDRLTLDFESGKSYLANLAAHLATALRQAKEQYEFVVKERQDQYLKEVRDLLKDLKGQSDLYSAKLRGILSNWLRDVLAALASVAFTLYSKKGDFALSEYNPTLDYILKILAVYYIVSVVLQTLVDWRDAGISRQELEYWKDVTRAYMPEEEFNRHFYNVLTPRRMATRWFYGIVIGLYLLTALLCWNYPVILNCAKH